jgi:NAD+ synthase (glutamine-hydrolysing)
MMSMSASEDLPRARKRTRERRFSSSAAPASAVAASPRAPPQPALLAMQSLVKIAACNLDQWAMDFDLNLAHTEESIRQAKAQGARFRSGPELELAGYGCEDHFLENDTIAHCWESMQRLLDSDLTDGILCDIGMPVLHRAVRYNCRVLVLNRKVICVRPKVALADDGNYRETRWFTAWTKLHEVQELQLPPAIQLLTGQRTVPFGMVILMCNDASIAIEMCEELFTPNSPNILLGLNGADIVVNPSGSHHNLRKLSMRMDLIREATAKNGGAYMYSNQRGCDGGRLYFDGCASIIVNGEVVAQGSQFSLLDVELVTAVVDLEDVRSFRAAVPSRSRQAATVADVHRVRVDFDLVSRSVVGLRPTPPGRFPLLQVEEEIGYGPACWLWDYLRRSGGGGYFLPLSGGADSAASATIVGIMCEMVCAEAKRGNARVIADARLVTGEREDSAYVPADRREFCSRIFHTCYMGTSNSSTETRARAKAIAEQVGAYHMDVNIDSVVGSLVNAFEVMTGKRPRYRVHGGSNAENLALQNIQARLRMVLSYMLAQLLPWVRGRGGGFLLVLGSANVDEALRGYLTKYDCSSADVNPIGGISKGDLKRFLLWAADSKGFTALRDIVAAPPTAELEPISAEYKQADEVDMGMTYEELGVFGRLRKIMRAGPVSMFEKLRHMWADAAPQQVAEKVKRFFFFYAVNRHKQTTLTPSYHAENYSPDDNRFDHRQFLYNARWPRQFADIDRLVEAEQRRRADRQPPTAQEPRASL